MPENTPAQNNNNPDKRALLRRAALEYHEFPKPGKIAIAATKQMVNQHDLALAYSPGVAAPCEEIVKDPNAAFKYTARGNLVGVVTNGTAVLGLGDIGPLAGKPVMEGKAVLFKKFSGIDVFDIEINEKDPEKLVEIIASLEPTFGGINLEDIKAPDCFYVERKLRERMKIPVFHDDQHGTAITVGRRTLGRRRERDAERARHPPAPERIRRGAAHGRGRGAAARLHPGQRAQRRQSRRLAADIGTHFVVYVLDKLGSGDIRAAHRDAHRARLREPGEALKVLTAGPMLEEYRYI